jgi:energy-coupling factor transporter ATP-binding protein EcfA2
MLRNLQIRDLAIIDAVEIDFASGLTVLTGETGAGKSIILDAISALVAIAPAFVSRGGHLPALSLALLLVVFATGLLASLAATVAALFEMAAGAAVAANAAVLGRAFRAGSARPASNTARARRLIRIVVSSRLARWFGAPGSLRTRYPLVGRAGQRVHGRAAIVLGRTISILN